MKALAWMRKRKSIIKMDFNKLNFSFESYEMLLAHLNGLGYQSLLIGEAKRNEKILYLRHDVDVDFLTVMDLAQIESDLGMQSTWYFLPNCPIYNLLSDTLLDIAQELNVLGHQIGLHIDASLYENVQAVENDLNRLFDFYSSYIPINKTFSFHRPASWALNDISIEGWVNAYQREYYSDVMYVSDSNRREFWKEDRISRAISDEMSLTLLTHPLWWKENSYSKDKISEFVYAKLGSEVAISYLADTCNLYSNAKKKGAEESYG